MQILKRILVICSFIFLMISVFILVILLNINYFFTTEQMQKNIRNIDIVHEMKKITNSSATSSNKAEIIDIIDSAYTEADNHNIDRSLVDEIFNSDEVKNFLGTSIGSFTDYFVNGKKTDNITVEDFNKLIDDNIDSWIKNSNTDISDSKKEVLVIRMKTMGSGIVKTMPTKDYINEKIDTKTLKTIRFIFGNKLKLILFGITIISFLIIVFIKKKESISMLLNSLLIVSLLTIGISFITPDIIGIMLDKYNLNFLLSALTHYLANNIFISGIVILIIYIVSNIIYKKISQ